MFPTTTQTFVRSAVLVQLFELHPACVGETRVVFILSKLTAREVANSVVGSSQLVAPLLSDQLIGVAQAHAEHRLDVAECWHDRVVRTAACKPCLAPMLPFAFWHL